MILNAVSSRLKRRVCSIDRPRFEDAGRSVSLGRKRRNGASTLSHMHYDDVSDCYSERVKPQRNPHCVPRNSLVVRERVVSRSGAVSSLGNWFRLQ